MSRGAASFYPRSLPAGPFQYFDVLSGLGTLADGAPVDSWLDQSGNALHLSNVGAARPTFRAGDLDNLPYLAFRGGTQFLFRAGDPAYVGTVLSLYALVRPFHASSPLNGKLCSLGRAGVVPGGGAGTFALNRNASPYWEYRRDGVSVQAAPLASGASVTGDWCLFSMRCGPVPMDNPLRALDSLQTNEYQSARDWGAPAAQLPFNYTGVSVGAGITGGGIDVGSESDFRAFALWRRRLNDREHRDMMRFLAARFAVAGILD